MHLNPTPTAPESGTTAPRYCRDRFHLDACEGAGPGSLRLLNFAASSYHAELERQSCSLLKPLLASPARYKAQFFETRKCSDAMAFGSLLHNLVLEPHLFHTQYVVVPGSGKLSAAESRAFAATHPGKTVLLDVEFQEMRLLADRVLHRLFKGRPVARYLEEGIAEATFFYDDPVTGVPCRVRLDMWHPDFIFDLKTTRHGEVLQFVRNAVDLHYDLQAYMYCLADALWEGRAVARPFVFLAANSQAPYPVHVLTAGSTFLDNGRAKYERALSLYKACAELDYWPDGSADEDIELEPWQQFRPGAVGCAPSDDHDASSVAVPCCAEGVAP
jgi:hypothetical protein